MRHYAWLLIGLVASVICGCNIDVGNGPGAGAAAGIPKALKEQIGKACTVQFRRDALGAAMDLPVSPTTGGINGADVTVAGTLEAVDNEWLVVKSGSQGLFIRQSAVLVIQVELERKTSSDHAENGHR
jgi:hypothetical protein